MIIVGCWAETVVVTEPSGDMPVVGDKCARCETRFRENESVGMPVNASPNGHPVRHEWVCGLHMEPHPRRRFGNFSTDPV